MGKIAENLENLPVLSQTALQDGGRLNTAIPGFKTRDEQVVLTTKIAESIVEQSILVAEAGTGTGKTYAYLTPCLLSGKKTLISTATKTLQDQLVNKDLPTLIGALGLAVRVQNLKGRSNYICRYRTKLHALDGQFISQNCASDILHVYHKISKLKQGDRSELPDVSENSEAWPFVTSTIDNCLGRDCPDFSTCFLASARKRALEADVVVINHHLYFADLKLKDTGFAELLPSFHTVIFDEAHQITEIATNFHGSQVSTKQFRLAMDDMLREWPVFELVSTPLKQYSFELDKLIDALILSLQNLGDKISWFDALKILNFKSAVIDFKDFIKDWCDYLSECSINDNPGLNRSFKRLEDLNNILENFTFEKDSNDIVQGIYWLESFKRTLVFHKTPVDITEIFKNLINDNKSAYIFTSATLTISQKFECFLKPLGLSSAKTLYLPSPFDYKRQALLYLPRGMPDTRANNYYDVLLARAIPIINALGGKCFFLFTSHRAIKQVAKKLENNLNFPLLVQGDESKPILLERFRAMGNAVLLGAATFWEGVDVSGDALSCVIIDKLPFANPVDPIIRGKIAYFQAKGLSGFEELSLPNAVISLKQGFGRLIRDVSDKGVFMLADPRLTSRDYGSVILASLPVMQKTRDEAKVLDFIKQLVVKDDEITCT